MYFVDDKFLILLVLRLLPLCGSTTDLVSTVGSAESGVSGKILYVNKSPVSQAIPRNLPGKMVKLGNLLSSC